MQKLMLPIAGAVVALILALAIFLSVRPTPAHVSPAMFAVEGSDIGGPFELTAHTGERITSAEVIDRPALVYFGYTFCPDICPIDTQVMADTVDLLAEKNIDVKPVFVTVDPARDTPEELSYYAEAMHPKMIALTGSEADIRAAADAYRVFYQKSQTPGSEADYLMQHTGFTYLMGPGDELLAMFRRDFPAEQIAGDVEKVLAAQ
ncbi:MAG: SCO family protein [Pseudomonadota bacterium]